MQNFKFANEATSQDGPPLFNNTFHNRSSYTSGNIQNSKVDYIDQNYQYFLPKEYQQQNQYSNNSQNTVPLSSSYKSSTPTQIRDPFQKNRRILSEQQNMNTLFLQHKSSISTNVSPFQQDSSAIKSSSKHQKKQTGNKTTIQKEKQNNTPFRAMVENVLQTLGQQTKTSSKCGKNNKQTLKRREQSVSCLSEIKDQVKNETLMSLQQSREDAFNNMKNSQNSQLRSQTALQEIIEQAVSQNQYKRSNTPNSYGFKKKQSSNLEMHKFISSALVAQESQHNKKNQNNINNSAYLQQKSCKTPKAKSGNGIKLARNQSHSANIIAKKQQQQQYQQQPQQQQKPIHSQSQYIIPYQAKKLEKTTYEKKIYIMQKLGAVIKGYKVRRILKQNKAVSMLRVEYKDLLKFANSLKSELTENLRNNSSQTTQTRQLLIQSIKDLSQKKEQFFQVFEEALSNPKWLKISQPISFYDSKKYGYKSIQLVNMSSHNSYSSAKNLKTTDKLDKSHIQQFNDIVNLHLPLNIINERNSSQPFRQSKTNSKNDNNDLIKKGQQKQQHQQQQQSITFKKYLTSNSKFESEISTTQQPLPQQDDCSLNGQSRKDFLKKGIQSRKYDPRVAIEQEKQRKKELQETIKTTQMLKNNNVNQKLLQTTQNLTFSKQGHQKEPLFDSVPVPQVLKTEPSQQELILQQAAPRLSQKFASKIPRLNKKESNISQSMHFMNKSQNQSQSTKHLGSSFLAPIIDRYGDDSPVKNSCTTISRIPKLRRDSKTASIAQGLTNNHHLNKTSSEIPESSFSGHQTIRTARSRENNRNSSMIQEQFQKKQRHTSIQSCNFGESNLQMQQLIKELQNAEINKEAKQKTIETLNAITGMLDSLRNKQIFQEESTYKNERRDSSANKNNLKNKFDVRNFLLINYYLIESSQEFVM